MKRTHLIFFLFLFCNQLTFGQKKVAITIDDVPNTRIFESDDYKSVLLEKLDSMNIPIAIFINEGLIYKTDSVSINFNLLNEWCLREYVTLGNHSFSHARYSDLGKEEYTKEIINGESITRQLAIKYDKSLKYFRFPYNDMGMDSLQHIQGRNFLNENDYIVTPFTIESSDWMYNAVYKYHLEKGEFDNAKKVGEEYVSKTLEYFNFFEKMVFEDYGREINHIYLCHDNKLNTDFLPKLVAELQKKEYHFIHLDEAMTDEVYAQEDKYYKKWGISWLYRWKETQKERLVKMKQEPTTDSLYERYNVILKETDN